MATLSLSVVRVRRNAGRAYVDWSDGTQTEFDSLAAAKSYARSLAEERETLRKLLLSRYFFLDPNATNPALVEGRTITVTNESNTMVTVS